ncbi:MAG: uroporphyrinogen decarboxylase family protein [Eubacteriaceae bacterium]
MESIAISEQSQERKQNFIDVYEGRIPKRIPITIGVDGAASIEYAGMDLVLDQYSADKMIEAMDYTNKLLDTDQVVGFSSRLPSFYKMLGAKNYVMGGDGFMQHPDVHGMEPEDYDALIADPIAVCWEKVLPKFYTELAKPAPNNMIALMKMQMSMKGIMGKVGPASAKISAKYGKAQGNFIVKRTRAPYDLLADTFRSFTGVNSDIRRYPQKVLDACEALLPLALKLGMPTGKPDKKIRVGIALHMATYMREKDFAKFWWPTYKRMIEEITDAGFGVFMFCEENWMRYLDYLKDLPAGCEMQFEYGDPKVIKEKIGDKHIIQGIYPIALLRSGSVQEVEDKAKELMDILAPGGNYVFGLDKGILRASDAKVENVQALLKCIQQYGVYS